MSIIAQERYAKYPESVQEYMRIVVNYLEEKYGELDEIYLISLDMMAMNLEMMMKSRDNISSSGYTVKDSQNRVVKNHAVQNFNNAQSYLIKLINQFGFTPSAKKKLMALDKLASSEDTSASPMDEFV